MKCGEYGEYNFSVTNEIGYTYNKKLVVDENNTKNIIELSLNPLGDKELTTEVEVNIDYSKIYQSTNRTNQYKIGNSAWTNYTQNFKIDSYTVLNKGWQESDNKTVIVYARSLDRANNIVTISKETIKLDLDMPDKPVITQTTFESYASVTEYGVGTRARVVIDYGTRTDIDKIYSLDNGQTWKNYVGEFECDAIWILARSVKKNSGLYNQSDRKHLIVTAPSSLGTLAYDGITSDWQALNTSKYYIYVSEEMQGRPINITAIGTANNISATYGRFLTVRYLDSEGNILGTNRSGNIQYAWSTNDRHTTYNLRVTIPDKTNKIEFYGSCNSHGYGGYTYCGHATVGVANIEIRNEPIISSEKHYAKIGEYGISQGYDMISISYFQTSVQKLYKIDQGDWKIYENRPIRLELGQTLYAKGIDIYGEETIATSNYTGELPSNGLNANAYNSNTNNWHALGTSKFYLEVDSTIYGRPINITAIGTANNISATYGRFLTVRYLDSEGNILGTNRSGNIQYAWSTNDRHTTYNLRVTIPDKTNKIEFYGSCTGKHEYCGHATVGVANIEISN